MSKPIRSDLAWSTVDRNVVRGERLVIDTRTNKATLTPTASGGGRVRGVFYPNQTQAPAPANGAAARP